MPKLSKLSGSGEMPEPVTIDHIYLAAILAELQAIRSLLPVDKSGNLQADSSLQPATAAVDKPIYLREIGKKKKMTYSYDLSSPIGLTRLLIPDRDLVNALFTDEELQSLLVMEVQVPKRAAALALETVAADRTMVLQVIRSNGLSTDGASVARALIARAEKLREQALTEEAYAEGGSFDYAEQVTGNFAYKERIWDEIMRTEGSA